MVHVRTASVRKLSHISSENYDFTAVKNCSILHRYVIVMISHLDKICMIRLLDIEVGNVNIMYASSPMVLEEKL